MGLRRLGHMGLGVTLKEPRRWDQHISSSQGWPSQGENTTSHSKM